jgi:hypothetical protein
MWRKFWLAVFGLLTVAGMLAQPLFTLVFFRFTDFSDQAGGATVGSSMAPGGGNAVLGLIIVATVLIAAVVIVAAVSTAFFVATLVIAQGLRIQITRASYIDVLFAWLFLIVLPCLLNLGVVLYAAKHPPVLNL